MTYSVSYKANICSFADDTTPLVHDKTLESVLDKLEVTQNLPPLGLKTIR